MSWTLHSEYPVGTAFGACFKCRASLRPGERVLEPNIPTWDMPPELVPGGSDGWMCFCETCITEAAQTLGMVTAKQSDDLRVEVAHAHAAASTLSLRAEAAEDALSALRYYDESTPARTSGSTDGR